MKSINTLIINAFAILILFSGCNYGRNCVNASRNQKTETRTVDVFSKISVGGSAKVFLTQGEQQSVSITASDNILPLLESEVRGEELNINLDRDVCRAGDIEIRITMKDLSGISISGNVDVKTENRFRTGDLHIDLSGSTDLDMEVEAKDIRTTISGNADITMKGRASSHSLEVSGSGKLNAFDMPVGNYDIEASGAAGLDLFVLNDLKVTSSGASSIKYKGNPKSVTNESSGVSSVRKVN